MAPREKTERTRRGAKRVRKAAQDAQTGLGVGNHHPEEAAAEEGPEAGAYTPSLFSST